MKRGCKVPARTFGVVLANAGPSSSGGDERHTNGNAEQRKRNYRLFEKRDCRKCRDERTRSPADSAENSQGRSSGVWAKDPHIEIDLTTCLWASFPPAPFTTPQQQLTAARFEAHHHPIHLLSVSSSRLLHPLHRSAHDIRVRTPTKDPAFQLFCLWSQFDCVGMLLLHMTTSSIIYDLNRAVTETPRDIIDQLK